MGLYDAYLAMRHRLHDGEPPAHVAVVVTERNLLTEDAFDTLSAVLGWTLEYGADRVTVSVSVLDEAVVPTLVRELRRFDAPAPTTVCGPDDTPPVAEDGAAKTPGSVGTPIRILVGLGGKAEFAAAVRDLARDAVDGEISPETIDERDVADRLLFPEEPDLVIKTGPSASRISPSGSRCTRSSTSPT